MIHYALRCAAAAHAFDGWFASSAGFEHQAAAGLLTCPVCGDARVERALMAPRLGGYAAAPATPAPPPADPAPPAAATPPATAAAGLPDGLRAALARLRAEVESRCDPVGHNFAEQARAMHEHRLPHRPIWGTATDAEADALADDGIEVARLPWVPLADA